MHLFGEFPMSRGEMEAALESMNQVIAVFGEVNNVRQLWQAHVTRPGLLTDWADLTIHL
jgi:hypothetical protein